MKKQIKKLLVSGMLLLLVTGCTCGTEQENTIMNQNHTTPTLTEAPVKPTGSPEDELLTEPTGLPEDETPVSKAAELESFFNGLEISETYKKIGHHNPLVAQKFTADPTVLVYNDRVYIYTSTDAFEYDAEGNIVNNTYKMLKNIHVISSADMVNWTDHGTIYVAGSSKARAAQWANLSWAPAAVCKEIDGETKFFLYFANGGGGIGVLSADSPTGPFSDPLGKALVTSSTKNCNDVVWMFDPAVFVDDDGSAYLYFGGGIPEGCEADPGTARVVKLGADMISLDGEPARINPPYFFEDSGVNKIGDTYYYSYCSNWNVTAEAKAELGIGSAQICYMTGDSPMGPFTLQGILLKNPGDYFGNHYNNHHTMFEFQGKWYITYHSQLLENTMGYKNCYRSVHIDSITVNEDGTIKQATGTKLGVDRICTVDPYMRVEAEMLGTMGGINTTQVGLEAVWYGAGNMAVNEIDSGDWTCIYGVDFGATAAKGFMACINSCHAEYGVIQIRVDGLDGEVIGYLEVLPEDTDEYTERTAELYKEVTGEHDLFFIYYGSGYSIDFWQFSR